MNADEIPVGAGFLGSMWNEDWRKHWKAGKPIPGELVRVTTIVPRAQRGDQYLKELLKLHANHLHSDSSSQISCPSMAFWVVGVRETRSAKVYVFDWATHSPQTTLELLHTVLKSHGDAQASALEILEPLAVREVPYL